MSNELSGMTVLSPTGAPTSVIPKNIKPKKTTGDIPGMSIMSESGLPTSVVAKNDKPKDRSMLINTAQQEVQYCPVPDNWGSSSKSPSSKDIQITNTGQQHNEMLYTKVLNKLQMNDAEKNTFQRDKRVSLTVRPRIYNTDNDNSMMRRVIDILGGLGGGILFNYCLKSYGIIFPYTPQISGLGKTVTYESVDIPHSNLKFNQYKNTSSNDISLKAKFTADNRKNALSMISSIWFLNSCSSSKFGKNDDEAGLPPPVLYLNGYNDMIDNIPVVITSFDYNLDDKSQYVKLIVSSNGEIIEEPKTNNNSNLIYWLPTELDISIKLKIQPNVRKVYDEWSLDKYKKGELFGSLSRSNSKYIPSGWTW